MSRITYGLVYLGLGLGLGLGCGSLCGCHRRNGGWIDCYEVNIGVDRVELEKSEVKANETKWIRMSDGNEEKRWEGRIRGGSDMFGCGVGARAGGGGRAGGEKRQRRRKRRGDVLWW